MTAPVNNWNPWIHSNLLTCALLLDRDDARRAQTVHKILTSLDRFLDSYHEDGGLRRRSRLLESRRRFPFRVPRSACAPPARTASITSIFRWCAPSGRTSAKCTSPAIGMSTSPMRRRASSPTAACYTASAKPPAMPACRPSALISINTRVPARRAWDAPCPPSSGRRNPQSPGQRSPGAWRRGCLAYRSPRPASAPARRTASTSPPSAGTTPRATITTTWAITSFT
jgi:hypothetical protein